MRLVLFLLFVSLNAAAQDQEAKLFFKDGTTVLGYGSLKLEGGLFDISNEPKILFRVSMDQKADEWDYEMIDKIVFFFFEDAKTFKYLQMSGSNDKIKNLLLEEITEGAVSLYKTIDKTVTKRNGVHIDPGSLGLTEYPSTTAFNIRNKHFLFRQGEKFVTLLRPFKKDISDYFKDCPGIKKKLDNGEINSKDLQYIVEYYNDYCSGYEFEAEDYEPQTDVQKDDD